MLVLLGGTSPCSILSGGGGSGSAAALRPTILSAAEDEEVVVDKEEEEEEEEISFEYLDLEASTTPTSPHFIRKPTCPLSDGSDTSEMIAHPQLPLFMACLALFLVSASAEVQG